MSRAIDADALEKEGWSLHRTIRVDMNTSEYQTKPLKQVPTIEPEQRWIPCSERVPEQPNPNPELEGKPLDIYLVCKQDNIPFRAFWNGRNFADGWTSLDVDAWMPLPEPYRGEGEK